MKSKEEISAFINGCYKLKPDKLIMSELKWKYLIRSAMRGKNTMIIGPAGQGKTLSIQCLAEVLKDTHPFFYISLGSTQDPRATLVGNTHFSKESGTYFQQSPFVTAITTPNSIILLDELSRAHPDAANILLTVLDYNQRYLRLDEKDGSVVKVADGVTFFATANIGNEYTNTRVMDRALLDRFTVKIEMDMLTKQEELTIIKNQYPSADIKTMQKITEIASITRQYFKDGKVNKGLSTRSVVEMAELTSDGFTLSELADMVIYPEYPSDGDIDSERTMIKQVVQKFTAVDTVDMSADFEITSSDPSNDTPPF
jgi:MoxR-like ATPase